MTSARNDVDTRPNPENTPMNDAKVKVDHKSIYSARKTRAAAHDTQQEQGTLGSKKQFGSTDPEKIYAARRVGTNSNRAGA